jgi:Flp pilus assembly protein TadG
MVIIPLLLLTFAIIDFAGVFYVYLALENGLSQATRYGITGQRKTVTDPMTGLPTTLDRRNSIIRSMQEATPTLDLSGANFTFSNITNATGEQTGGPGDIFRVTVTYNWNIMTPLVKPFFTNGCITLQVNSAVKNETFPSS